MATTVMAVSDQQLGLELHQRQAEATSIRKKIEDDAHKLEAAHAERERIVDGLTHGHSKESDVARNKSEIDHLQMRVESHNRLLGPNSRRQDELRKEIYRRQGVAAQAARQKEFAELYKQGEDEAKEIVEQLTRLVTENVPAFDAIRRKLGSDFRDLDGETAAWRLREMLWKAPGPRDALHDPNVHLRRLFDQGWELAGKPGPSYEVLPGGELLLTVASLRTKK
jgi:hypothetical protein